jgi:hypothetical protein
MTITRARWLTGALIAVGALVVASQALATYIAGHLVVGIVAVLVLMAVLVIGFTSLARARLYIARELVALAAQPPGGVLFLARRQQAVELRRRNVTPDLDVLADATTAEEAERAYAGKYLVATTVLIGLVGTFGGLMETLARVAPLLKGDLGTAGPAGALGLIAGPLAGLHVTFGTSVVAILVTLALALVQGDVTLRHEQLLALLHERTRHVLIPELWPAEESAAERTVQALVALRAFVAEALTAGAEASATRIAAVVRAEVQRLVTQVGDELRGSSVAQTAALTRASATMTDSLRETTAAAAKELRDTASTSRQAMTEAATTIAAALQASDARARAEAAQVIRAVEAAAEATRRETAALMERAVNAVDRTVAALAETTAQSAAAFTASTTAAAGTLAESTARTSASFLTSTTAALAALAESTARTSEAATAASREVLSVVADAAARTSESVTASATAVVAALAGTTARTADSFTTATTAAATELAEATARTSESFTAATTAAVTALAGLRTSEGERLEETARALTSAAADLRATVETLAPPLAQLTPQLGALATEVALLAARADSPEQSNAVLDELVRLGEDVERLVTAGQTFAAAGTPAPAVAPEGSES